MVAPLAWVPSQVFCYEVDANAGGVCYAITRHTRNGHTQGAHLAFAGEKLLGEFAEGAPGLAEAKRTCQSHANNAGAGKF